MPFRCHASLFGRRGLHQMPYMKWSGIGQEARPRLLDLFLEFRACFALVTICAFADASQASR
jgi:hypothetical protein